MSILKILQEPDVKLRRKSLQVERIDSTVLNLVKDMVETMYASGGIGLAAPQVDVLLNIITIDIAEIEDKERVHGFFPLCLINPNIVQFSSDLCSMKEGCLSVPEEYIDVTRPQSILVEYTNEQGKKLIIPADGLLGRVIQHEMDHLDGKLIIDYLPPLTREMKIKKLKKLKN